MADIMYSPVASEVIERTSVYREQFGFDVNVVNEPERFEQLTQELNPRFDGDRELVRFELEQTDDSGFTAAQKGAVIMTASALEMLDTETPLTGEFNLIIPIGAARMANYDRTRYAAEAIKSGAASGRLVVVGSTRPLVKGEAEAAASYTPEGAETEADLVKAAAQKVSEELDMDIAHYIVEDPKAHNELILEAAREAFAIKAGQRVAAVTTQIYRVPAALDFMRVGARHSIETSVAGNPSDLKIVGNRTVATYNAEIIRALRAVSKVYQEQ